MMSKIGVSTGCYYPRPTETIIEDIAKTGATVLELFINTHSEMSDSFIKEIKRQTDFYGLTVGSVHPFTSFAESYLFFSEYSKRFSDGVDIYKRYFEISNILGAEIVNFHGMNTEFNVDFERYCECYGKLYVLAKEAGIVFAQENVRRCVCGDLNYIKRFSEYMGNDVSFTFDVKQAHMAGSDPMDFAKIISDKIRLVHLNDYDSCHSCLLPGNGSFDTAELIRYLSSESYCGNYIIEVYSGNYTDENDIVRSVKYTETIFRECYR